MQNFINEINQGRFTGVLISTTSKVSNDFRRLPNRKIYGKHYANILVTNEQLANNIMQNLDGKVTNILIDVEKKQSIDLKEIARKQIKKTTVFPYKPNDITLEAADQLVLHQTKHDLTNKSIIIFGTGNLAFKLALRLLEREANVYLVGRDEQKVSRITETLNIIKPRYSEASAKVFNSENTIKYDGVVSFISAEQVINSPYVNNIKSKGFAIDGGIGNFTGEFIALCLEKSISVSRLDVRLGNSFLEASIHSLSKENIFFEEIMGAEQVNNLNLVAGGIIGNSGSIIIDRIKNPSQIIGIANGYGGLKNERDYTETDKENLQYAKETLL